MPTKGLSGNLKRMAHDGAELPGLRLLARPVYRMMFDRGTLPSNSYYGVYSSYSEALAQAPKSLPTGYDLARAADLYHERLDSILVGDYPILFWLSQIFMSGQRTLFDLGGHIGISYYGFQSYIDYPDDLSWLVYDLPALVSAGRAWAGEHDTSHRLSFTQSLEDADGCGILLASGALQYLDFTLPEMLGSLREPPRHVLVNVTPLHPSRSFFTLQQIGALSSCPYRVMAMPDLLAQMEALGYTAIDRWESFERYMRIPFEGEHSIDRYYGFYFQRN
ncbi:putative methyltransferase, LIC12133 family [Pseudoxanthomonas sp. GM95]|uniref:methyltransferase, TIGR04325 family n=1 Tax=Pseudoxanthomonas sp. GM95 TaxID=1881043 RepID=UPI0008B88CC9|nr:methyltransferase, TIGR04325 family [Pseudoxanthomonas sp. GM95]SEL09038.1 putative methyltransferase, LIC12133 family [Pseudoxanthomonas sp. GM95]